MHGHNRLLWAILAGAVAGILCGGIFGTSMMAIGWIGNLFLDALKMTIIPLITASVITGITSIGDVRKLGRLGAYTVAYYLVTTGAAVLVGLVLVNLVHPGSAAMVHGTAPADLAGREPMGFTDIVRSLVAPNLVAAASETRLPPLILFCVLFAAALTTVGTRARPVVEFFESLNDVMLKLVIWIMYISPLGIFALIAARLGATGGGRAFLDQISGVGRFFVTVVLGLTVSFSLLFMLLKLVSGRGRAYLTTVARALLTAFGTASSSATLPLSLECVTEGGVDRRAARFVLPLGATVNMNGTALYEAVAAMFIAQAYGIDLSFGQQAVIFVTATVAAIGTAGVPQAGLVTMLIVLNAVHLPTEGIGLLLAVDWFLDRCRTTVNVWGDIVGAAVLEKLALEPGTQSAVETRGEISEVVE